jgi:hypothetical protein
MVSAVRTYIISPYLSYFHFLLIHFLGEIEVKDNEALEPPMCIELQKSSEDKSKNTKTARATTKRKSEHG